MPSFPTRESWLAAVAPVAVAMDQQYGFPANVLVAHWAVECAWGYRVIGGSNHCGMKWRERHGERKVEVTTHEWFTQAEADRQKALGKVLYPTGKRKAEKAEYRMVDAFADYATIEDCGRDFVHLLRTGIYASAWENYRRTDDWHRFVRDYMRHYATANKAELVIQIAEQANVRLAIALASPVERPVT